MEVSVSIKLAIAQINPTVGDMVGNAAKILSYHLEAAKAGVDLIIYPELSLVGYPPEDLVLMPAFRSRAMQMAQEIAEKTADGPALLIGGIWQENDNVFNAALLLDKGEIAFIQPKIALPNYGVFDEKRLFVAGDVPAVYEWRGIQLGVLICEDVWYPGLANTIARDGAELLIVLNASPFEAGKLERRKRVTSAAVENAGIPLVYVNAVGGQDDIVFDGGSFALAADGTIVRQLDQFTEKLEIVAAHKNSGGWQIEALPLPAIPDEEETLWRAMMLGLADYVGKNGFNGVVLGLSGGIDSALSAAVAVDALGASAVKGVLLPSPYTSQDSVDDALETARLLGIETMNVPITSGMELFQTLLSPVFNESDWMENVTLGGNVQARLRGLILMSISNRFGWMLLSTGNKSELAVGYSTLYGDSCGGYSVLKDVYKTQVYELAHWRNRKNQAIPQRSITKAPAAELAPGQTDQDQLPPYGMLDRILASHIEGRLSAQQIVAEGYPQAIVEKVVRMVRNSEYKRRQSCPGVKLSPMLFGKDRRYPLTHKF